MHGAERYSQRTPCSPSGPTKYVVHDVELTPSFIAEFVKKAGKEFERQVSEEEASRLNN
jgi:hypothetical protein